MGSVGSLAVEFQGVQGISPSSTNPQAWNWPLYHQYLVVSLHSCLIRVPLGATNTVNRGAFGFWGFSVPIRVFFWWSPPLLHHLASKEKAPVSSIPGLFSCFFFNSRPPMYVQCSQHSRIGFARVLCCQTTFWKCHTASHHISPPSLMPIAPERIAL